MKKQVKKLPAVWVGFDDVGVEWCTVRKPSNEDRRFNMIGPVHKYVPAKPARKVCRWYLDRGATEAQNFYDAECGYQRGDLDPDFKFCPNCGKRVREVGKQ